MKYTFLLYSNPADFKDVSEEDMAQMQQVYGQYIGALQQAGVFVSTDWLSPVEAATTLSLKGGSKQVQDGPFAETKETLGGYFVIDVPDLDAAIAWAEKCPAAKTGKVEIRHSLMDE